MEVSPPNEVPEQAPPANAGEEEETTSNPPPTEDEPTPITLDAASLANAREEKLVSDIANDAP